MPTRALIVMLFLVSLTSKLQAVDEHTIPGVAASTSSILDFNDLDTPVQMIDQEFDPSLLDSLVPLSSAPAQIRLPPALIQSDQWQGSQCGIGKPAYVVFRKPADWEKFWTLAIKPYLTRNVPTPTIDFSKDMVVGVFRGDGARPGDLIQIQSVKAEYGGADPLLIVKYRNSSKMQPVFIPPFSIQPFHLKKVAAFPGKVSFRNQKQ